MKIRTPQIENMAVTTTADRLASDVREVHQALRDVRPSPIPNGMPEPEALSIIERSIRAANGFGIRDLEDLCRFCHVRFVIGLDFFHIREFRYFLDEPLIHPRAKARNVVTSFMLARAAQGGAR